MHLPLPPDTVRLRKQVEAEGMVCFHQPVLIFRGLRSEMKFCFHLLPHSKCNKSGRWEVLRKQSGKTVNTEGKLIMRPEAIFFFRRKTEKPAKVGGSVPKIEKEREVVAHTAVMARAEIGAFRFQSVVDRFFEQRGQG